LGTFEGTKWIFMTYGKDDFTFTAFLRITARITIIVFIITVWFFTTTTRATFFINKLFNTTISNNDNKFFIWVGDITILLDGVITHAFFAMFG
jgi:hypothetical protein